MLGAQGTVYSGGKGGREEPRMNKEGRINKMSVWNIAYGGKAKRAMEGDEFPRAARTMYHTQVWNQGVSRDGSFRGPLS